MLEGGRGISETESHDQWFKLSVSCGESGLPFISFLHVDIVIPPVQVNFGEDFGSTSLIQELIDEGQRVPVVLSNLVKVPVVMTEVEFSILFLDKEDQAGSRSS